MAVKDKGYARPELLVDTDWMQDRLLEPSIRLVDCGFWESYSRVHIPGAVGVKRDHYFKDPTTGNKFINSSEQFAEEMESLGVGDDTQVVAYDDFGGLWATRLWWALKYYGHQNVRVLDGGWRKWLRERRPMTDAKPEVVSVKFTPAPNPAVIATAEQVMAECITGETANPRLKTGELLLDVRSDSEYTGKNDRGNARAGHMPGATHIEWLNLVTDDDVREFKPASELKEILEVNGITNDKRITTY